MAGRQQLLIGRIFRFIWNVWSHNTSAELHDKWKNQRQFCCWKINQNSTRFRHLFWYSDYCRTVNWFCYPTRANTRAAVHRLLPAGDYSIPLPPLFGKNWLKQFVLKNTAIIWPSSQYSLPPLHMLRSPSPFPLKIHFYHPWATVHVFLILTCPDLYLLDM